MRHFVFEFITGGGLAGQVLPTSLATEGDLMARALVSDLKGLPDSEVILCRDQRLASFDKEIQHCFIQQAARGEVLNALQADDTVWLIAPETDGCLLDWASFFRQQPVNLLLSDIDSIRICSSKYQTFLALKAHQVPVVDTVLSTEPLPASSSGWIIKPDDGAGAEGVYWFDHVPQPQNLKADSAALVRVMQPFVEGEAMSFAMLCHAGHARVIACNRQELAIEQGRLVVQALAVNACVDQLPALSELAAMIASAMPGLRGYIGVDLVRTSTAGYQVVEINPRLTTAYVGLSSSNATNMAASILDTFVNGQVPVINIRTASSVRIPL